MAKIINSIFDTLSALGMYALVLIVNAFSQSTYIKVEESRISHEG